MHPAAQKIIGNGDFVAAHREMHGSAPAQVAVTAQD
jgi:hypothetical protein